MSSSQSTDVEKDISRKIQFLEMLGIKQSTMLFESKQDVEPR